MAIETMAVLLIGFSLASGCVASSGIRYRPCHELRTDKILLGPNERIRNEIFTAQSFGFSPMSSSFFYRSVRLSQMVPADNKSDDPDRIHR
jgi:hypothetical protein